MVVYSLVGTVVLERQETEEGTIYSVVSAFSRITKKGTQIGEMPFKSKEST
ncbi:hypothetical protein [Stenoxybacter acetivorans]|uniref:hypothetical protein n=1 Tax=Stenoxybacter acetivorans TaxID=422441 RepID=UPI0012EB42E3|nr:hypothetical protein [Stenoxybacter acetivorans]